MRKLFLDTGYLIALEASDDQHHKQALASWKNLSGYLPLLVRTSYVSHMLKNPKVVILGTFIKLIRNALAAQLHTGFRRDERPGNQFRAIWGLLGRLIARDTQTTACHDTWRSAEIAKKDESK